MKSMQQLILQSIARMCLFLLLTQRPNASDLKQSYLLAKLIIVTQLTAKPAQCLAEPAARPKFLYKPMAGRMEATNHPMTWQTILD